jgi:hypothetical protein
METAIAFTGDGCLDWPFAATKAGYAKITIWHRQEQVARRVCEEVHGPPPTPEHHAAHSCGRGHLGCISPAHVRWATPSENLLERRNHGTAPIGEKHWTRRRMRARLSSTLERRAMT